MGLIVSDSFTEASTVNLTAHTPDTGTGWTEEEKTGVVVMKVDATDVAKPSADEPSDRILYSVQPDPKELDIALKFDLVNLTVSTPRPLFFVARLTDASNYYSAGTYANGNATDKRMFKKVAGTVTEIASADTGTLVNDRLEFLVEDASKKLLRNRHEVISSADNALTAVGRCGFGAGNAWVGNNRIAVDWHIDNFTVHDGVQTRLAGTGLSEAPGTLAWATPGNITADDEADASPGGIEDPDTSERLRSTQTGNVFAIPTGATVDGHEVEAEEEDLAAASQGDDIEAKLCKAGVPVGANRFSNPLPNVETIIVRGSATDLWGTTWNDSEVNATGYGFALRVENQAGGETEPSVDFFRFRVHYTPAAGGTPVSNTVVDLHEALQGIRQTV